MTVLDFKHIGIVGGIVMLIALGLILRYGGSANSILGTFFSGASTLTNSLSLSGLPGNNPPGVTSA